MPRPKNVLTVHKWIKVSATLLYFPTQNFSSTARVDTESWITLSRHFNLICWLFKALPRADSSKHIQYLKDGGQRAPGNDQCGPHDLIFYCEIFWWVSFQTVSTQPDLPQVDFSQDVKKKKKDREDKLKDSKLVLASSRWSAKGSESSYQYEILAFLLYTVYIMLNMPAFQNVVGDNISCWKDRLFSYSIYSI